MEPLNFKIPRDYPSLVRANHAAFATNSRKILTTFSTSKATDRTTLLIKTVAEGLDYAHGGKAPIEADRFTKIKADLSKIKTEGISGWVALESLMQTITLFQAFSNLYEALRNTPIKHFLPFSELLFPLASLYLKGEELLVNVQTWQEVQGTEEEKDATMKLVGNVASSLLYAAQVVVFFLATKMIAPVQVILSIVIYAITFFQLFKSEFNSEASQREKDRTPPKFALVP